jgi:hypothetical protein
MKDPILLWVVIILTIILSAYLGYIVARAGKRRIKRCVHFTVTAHTGDVYRGKYYFRGIMPEHEIKAAIQENFNVRGFYTEFISLIHVAHFDFPTDNKNKFVIDNP